MAFVQARTPFAVLDDSRLHVLTSIKNRQNNFLSQNASLKAPSSAPAKRRLASDMLADEFDGENVDPNILLSPSKRSKNIHGTPVKVSKFVISETIIKSAPSTLNPSMKRKALASSLPTTTTTTPITNLRGSPQNKRLQLLGSKRRSMTPYRRFDPPSKTAALPFSIDAALSGTISSYTPPAATAINAPEIASPPPVLSKKSSKAMPNDWFFEIHEDTPEEEATNLMEHSASTLDISSDDDSITARAKDALERGKENVPPPEWTGPTRHARSTQRLAHKGIACLKKAAKYATMGGPDAMLEDRIALREMDVSAFCPEPEAEKNMELPVRKDVENQSAEIIVEQVAPIAAVAPIDVPSIQEKEPIVICEDAPEVTSQATMA